MKTKADVTIIRGAISAPKKLTFPYTLHITTPEVWPGYSVVIFRDDQSHMYDILNEKHREYRYLNRRSSSWGYMIRVKDPEFRFRIVARDNKSDIDRTYYHQNGRLRMGNTIFIDPAMRLWRGVETNSAWHIRRAIEMGADIDLAPDGSCPLLSAVIRKHWKVVEELLRQGAEPLNEATLEHHHSLEGNSWTRQDYEKILTKIRKKNDDKK